MSSQASKDKSLDDSDDATEQSGLDRAGLARAGLEHEWNWLSGYNHSLLTQDALAALIVTVLLVPQALAYALLAGLPAQVGIYASIVPLAIYAVVGSSRHLSVGPTAVISLMTAVTISAFPEGERLFMAALLAFMSGGLLLLLGFLRAGFIMSFVPRPVVNAYVTGAAILIIFSQLRHVLGVNGGGTTVLELASGLLSSTDPINKATLLMGGATIFLLWLMRKYLAFGLYKLGLKPKPARLLSRFGSLLAVIVTTVLAAKLSLFENYGVQVVGDIPMGLAKFTPMIAPWSAYEQLFLASVTISLVGFIDSMSTAQTLAARSRTHIDANREMRALGASNIVSGFCGGYPINGSMSRSAVNFSAGAKTPLASLLAAILMTITALFLTPLLYHLPLVTLAALIIVACFSLFDFRHLWRTYTYSAADGLTAFATFLCVLVFGVEIGVLVGVCLSMALHIRESLTPHTALVGRFPGTEHYRDAERFDVETSDVVKTLRIDESLYYANARFLEDKVAQILADSPQMKHLILMCPAVNRIDASALNSLLSINKNLDMAGVQLHLSELHSVVADRLGRSTFFEKLTGDVYFTQHDAIQALAPEPDWGLYDDHIDIH